MGRRVYRETHTLCSIICEPKTVPKPNQDKTKHYVKEEKQEGTDISVLNQDGGNFFFFFFFFFFRAHLWELGGSRVGGLFGV